jgi:Leucine-rich repeat (LRR) protein
MSKMIALEEVDFWGNNMWGPIHEDFGRFMPNLTNFAMDYNFFNGTFPSGLYQGGKLQRLGVGGNQLEGVIPPSLARCISLVEVDLGNNQLTSIPDDFGCNSSLELLSVAHNQLEGNLPKGLGVNSSMAGLDMNDNRFTGDISILEFSQLTQNL